MNTSPNFGSGGLAVTNEVFLVLVMLAACERPVERATLFTARDSAGVRIAENSSNLRDGGEVWTIAEAPEQRTGADYSDTAQHFLRLYRVRGQASGGLVVINHGAGLVSVFDSTGRFRHHLGRRGQGPGEYSRLTDVYTCAGDTVVVNDYTRLLHYDSAGGAVRTTIRQSATDRPLGAVWGVTGDCRWLVVARQRAPEPGAGRSSYRPLIDLSWSDPEGATEHPMVSVPGLEVTTRSISGMEQMLPVPWGAAIVWTVAGQRLYVGSSSEPEIRVYEPPDRLVLIIRWREERPPVTDADRRGYEESRETWLRRFPQIGEIMPALEDLPDVPGRVPLFRTLLVDDEGRLWMRRYPGRLHGRPDRYDHQMPLWERPGPSTPPEEWVVVDASGRFVAKALIPADIDVRAIRNGRIIGVWKDQDDVEQIVWTRILRP